MRWKWNPFTDQIEQVIDLTVEDHNDLDSRDAADCHPAASITNTPAGAVVATDVQAAITELDGDLTTHMADTTTHGTTGDIVGTSDTQELTNKTLNNPQIKDVDGTPVGNALLTVIDQVLKIRNVANDADIATIMLGLTLSGKTSGRIPFFGTGGLISESANLLWDDGNSRLGVGVAPTETLHISGKILSNNSINVVSGSNGLTVGLGSMELWNSSGSVYIDLKDAAADDYDARIIKDSYHNLNFYTGGTGATVLGLAISAAGIISGIDDIGFRTNNKWLFGRNNANDANINMFKVNASDRIETGATLVVGASLEADEDSGAVTLVDMPVSATPALGTEESFSHKIDGNNVLTVGACADSAGGIRGEFVKNHGAYMAHRTAVGAADYNPSILTSDYIIAMTDTAAARAVTISTEDRDSGSTDNPRIFVIKDESGGANAQNITISLEGAGNIDGGANVVINTNYGSVTLYIDGTNGFTI